MNIPERQLWLYTAFILVAAVLSSHQFMVNHVATGRVVQAIAEETGVQDSQITTPPQKEMVTVPFSVESLGYVFLLAILLVGIYFVLVIDRVKNRLLKKQ